MTRWRLVTAAAVAATVVGACDGGGGDAVDPQAYAADVCAAMAEWQGTLQSAGQEMQTIDPSRRAEAKRKLVAFLDGLVERTDQTIGEIEDAGVPDVENGENASEALIASFENVNDSFAGFRADVEGVSTDDPQAFQAAVQGFGTEMQTSLGGLGERVRNLGSDELEEVFEQEQACENVAG